MKRSDYQVKAIDEKDLRLGALCRTKPLFVGMRVALFATISASLAFGQGAADPRAQNPNRIALYLKPQRLVPIAKGRAVNLVCLGQGTPTVVLTAGLGGWSQVWNEVQQPLSLKTRICAWDPGGLGFSSPSHETQDAIHQTEDLNAALKGAHIDGPFVMVAHSAGAYVALIFTDEHRKAVAGMVLVDPAIPDEAAVRERVAPKFAAFGAAMPAEDANRLRQCAAKLQSGELQTGTPGFDECTVPALPDTFSRLSATLAQLNAADPGRLLSQASAIASVSQSGREVVNPWRTYGNLPLMVLTAGHHPTPPDVPADVREQAEIYFRTLGAAHDAYAALSTRGRHQTVPNSSHFIQVEQPAAVIDAINTVLSEIRSQ